MRTKDQVLFALFLEKNISLALSKWPFWVQTPLSIYGLYRKISVSSTHFAMKLKTALKICSLFFKKAYPVCGTWEPSWVSQLSLWQVARWGGLKARWNLSFDPALSLTPGPDLCFLFCRWGQGEWSTQLLCQLRFYGLQVRWFYRFYLQRNTIMSCI